MAIVAALLGALGKPTEFHSVFEGKKLNYRPSTENVVESLAMKLPRLAMALLLIASPAAASPPIFGVARPMPGMNAQFEQTNNWIGGDGVSSVALTLERTLWLFSDTWVGSVRDGKRVNARIVNNTLALQDGHGTKAKLQFVIRHDAGGKPTAFLVPENKQGWFWLHSGACVGQRLYLFSMQMQKTGDRGVFGFRQSGEWLGVVTNPLASPLQWRIEQYQLLCTEFSAEHERTFGAATLTDGEYLYIYGTDEDTRSGGRERYLAVARVPTNEVTDFSAWRFYAGGQWETDYRKASHLTDRMATEYSVSYLPKLSEYLLIYTDRGMSPKIQARTAKSPWGKWSAPETIFQCPEMGKDKKIFCYAAKAHPEEETGDALIISYVANSFDVGQVIADASLYWPRFVQVPLASGEK